MLTFIASGKGGGISCEGKEGQGSFCPMWTHEGSTVRSNSASLISKKSFLLLLGLLWMICCGCMDFKDPCMDCNVFKTSLAEGRSSAF